MNRELTNYTPAQHIRTAFFCLVAAVTTLVVATAILESSWSRLPVGLRIVLVVATVCITLALLGLSVYQAYYGFLYQHEDLSAQRDERRRANAQHEMELYLAESRLHADERGNRPYIYDRRSGQVVSVDSGQFVQPVPNHYAPHNHYEYKDTSTRVGEEREQQELLTAGGVQAPGMDYVVSQLQENGLQVCLGVSVTTGKPFVMDLIDGTHYRIIGASGMGKSCNAAAILEMTTQTNDPDRLMIALLDLEHKTSRLFEHLPHVAELQVGRRRVDMVATSPDEVAEHFRYLRDELDRRKVLSEYDLQRERFMLIYVEEFLSLKREIDPRLKTQMLDDFSVLALRGRKYGLYLLACAQVDYADEQLRDAMNQFNVNMSFSVRPRAALAAGFACTELLNKNFEAKRPGQFVLETTGCTDLMLAPHYDVKQKLLALRSGPVPVREDEQDAIAPAPLRIVNSTRTGIEQASNSIPNTSEHAWQANVEQVKNLKAQNWGKIAIIEKVWGAKRGDNAPYRKAEAEYAQILEQLKMEA